ncbi:hypothetical protein Phi46:1_gp24 [Cellulophaga phage phi46:1]|uniref:hypothetical protein n=1 Tax=Cellulophaga phage phi46:1 TaxID=1327974 RepID=UPI000351BEC1|nr:hypothetical protein Phi46:1_gp24 [Cellulophaga phage phi46:1]AGO47835.1 hypothetical protein Phi46:1_gp24 [Cellulophaga phage phi46:1]
MWCLAGSNRGHMDFQSAKVLKVLFSRLIIKYLRFQKFSKSFIFNPLLTFLLTLIFGVLEL